MGVKLFRSLPFLVYIGFVLCIGFVAALTATTAYAADVVAAEPDWLSKFLAALPDWLQALSALIAAFSAIAAITPTPRDDGILLWLRKVVDFLALNIGGAKNEKSTKGDNRLS